MPWPALCKRSMSQRRGQHAIDVLHQQSGGKELLHKLEVGREEGARSMVRERLSKSGGGERLAGWSSGHQGELAAIQSERSSQPCWRHVLDRQGVNLDISFPSLVLEAQCVGAVTIHLDLDEHVPAGGLEPEVKASRA
jgi:hypothetical protein